MNRDHADEFADYLEHPRFGRGPRLTDLEPLDNWGWHYLASGPERIPHTGVRADPERHVGTFPYAVEYYFDLRRVCRDCGRKFIFFAEEQKHWYEDLQLPLDADAVRCVGCRKAERRIARLRQRYEELLAMTSRTAEETLELVGAGLTLVDEGLFGFRVLEHMRAILKSVPSGTDGADEMRGRADDLLARVHPTDR